MSAKPTSSKLSGTSNTSRPDNRPLFSDRNARNHRTLVLSQCVCVYGYHPSIVNAPLNRPPYNPRMLRWAREWRGRSIDEVAQKLAKRPEVIVGWENSDGAPTVRQARILADYYERPFLEFFLSEPPKLQPAKSVPDFRTYAGVILPPPDWEFAEILQWIATQRTNALELFEQIGEEPPEIPVSLFATTASAPDSVAGKVRTAIDYSFSEQVASGQARTLHDDIRARIEALGVLTLRRTRLKEYGVRGVCLADLPLPVIAFGNEAPTAQAFTLAHELGHILLRESGITGFRDTSYETLPVERWCDRFAASLLMQRSDIVSLHGAPPIKPEYGFDDGRLRATAKLFGVSPHAMIIRLVHLGYVAADYYWKVKKPELDREDAAFKSYGRAPYYGSRFKGRLGDLYTGLVLQAWSADRITNHSAAEYMGINNLSHLYDIREAFSRRRR